MSQSFIAQKSIEIAAPPAVVWAALTEPEKVKILFWGSDLVTDWVVGHNIIYKGVWDGATFEDKGIVLEFNPHHRIRYSYWSNFSGTPDTPENQQVITYQLEETKRGTLLSIEQSNIQTAESAEHSAGNWQSLLEMIKKMLETPG